MLPKLLILHERPETGKTTLCFVFHIIKCRSNIQTPESRWLVWGGHIGYPGAWKFGSGDFLLIFYSSVVWCFELVGLFVCIHQVGKKRFYSGGQRYFFTQVGKDVSLLRWVKFLFLLKNLPSPSPRIPNGAPIRTMTFMTLAHTFHLL